MATYEKAIKKAYYKAIKKAFPKWAQNTLDDLVTQLAQLYILSNDEIANDEFIDNILTLLEDMHSALTMSNLIQYRYNDAGLNAHVSQIEAHFVETHGECSCHPE
jgi:acyl-CoA reductase-like NAD-dependent aldehyde dehydrogenase